MSPTTLGMKAVGDPNLLRQIERGRSPSLRTADRILAFIDEYDWARAARGTRLGPGVAEGLQQGQREQGGADR